MTHLTTEQIEAMPRTYLDTLTRKLAAAQEGHTTTAAEAIAAGIAEQTAAEYTAQRYLDRAVEAALQHKPGTPERNQSDSLARIHSRRQERAYTAKHALIKAARAAHLLTEEEITQAHREGKHRAGVNPYTVGPDTSRPN